MALDTLTLNIAAPVNWNAQKNVTGANANQNASSATEAKGALGTAAAGNAANGLNELYFSIQSISASGTLALDFTSFTDILNAAGIVGARFKFLQIELLSTAQDSVNGTAASSITIDATVANALGSNSNTGWLQGGASTKLDIPNGGWISFGCTNAGGVVIDSTHKSLSIKNNDGSNAAGVKIVAGISTT